MNNVPREIYEIFAKYGRMMAALPYPLGEEAKMVLDTDEGVFGTKNGVNLANLKGKDVVKMSDGHLSTRRSGMVARVISQTPYCQQCLREGVSFRAVLDDMAMIIGPEAAVVNMTNPNRKKAAREMSLVFHNACGGFVQDRVRDGMPAGYTLTVGRNLYEAVNALAVLEKCAEIHLKARVIGGVKPLGRQMAKRTHTNYLLEYSAAEVEAKQAEMDELDELSELDEGGNTDVPDLDDLDVPDADRNADEAPQWDRREAELRRQLVDYGNKLVETGLVQGTWGNISVRLNDKFMLTTPSGLDYSRLTVTDMVKVDLATMNHEGNRKPTSEKELHAVIYQNRPAVHAVVHTHSTYCSIFAAANRDMPVEDAEAKQVFGDAVRVAKYAKAGTSRLARYAAEALGRNYGCLMANHGMLACGADLETAFANCQLMEDSAKKYIESRTAGQAARLASEGD